MRKFACILGMALVLAGCDIESILVNDSNLLSASRYYNGKAIIKPSIEHRYSYLANVSKLVVLENDYRIYGSGSYSVSSLKVIEEKDYKGIRYGIVSVDAISADSKNKITFTQTWILENGKWRVIAFPKEINRLRVFLSEFSAKPRGVDENKDDADTSDHDVGTDDKVLAKFILEKDPFNITACGILLLATKNPRERELSSVAFAAINPSDTEYQNILETIRYETERRERLIKERELQRARAAANRKDNEDRLTETIGTRAAIAASGNEALEMYQYKLFRETNGSAGYMDYVRSKANRFQDSQGKQFIKSALCSGAISSGNQRLIYANILGIRPMDFDEQIVNELCN